MGVEDSIVICEICETGLGFWRESMDAMEGLRSSSGLHWGLRNQKIQATATSYCSVN